MIMHPPYPGLSNETREYSPITLNKNWPAFGRFIVISLLATIGTISNGFFVATFFMEHSLKKIGNSFLACVGMADVVMTATVMPMSAVVILSGQWDNVEVCKFMQFLAVASTYSYTLFFTLVAIDSLLRLCCSTASYHNFASIGRIGLVAALVSAISIIVAGVGTYVQLDYDYCQRRHFGEFYFRVITNIFLQVIPFTITIYGLLKSAFHIRRRSLENLNYRCSLQRDRDHNMTSLNLCAYILFVLAWIPYIIIVHEFPATIDLYYYHSVMIGISRSLITSLLYSLLSTTFRRSFADLFYYCFCKTSLTHSFCARERRILEYRAGTRDIRVHIMQRAIPFKKRGGLRESQDL